MGRPLMLQDADDERIEALRQQLGTGTKIGVVRAALDLLEQRLERRKRVARWRRVARLAAPESRSVMREFRGRSRLPRVE